MGSNESRKRQMNSADQTKSRINKVHGELYATWKEKSNTRSPAVSLEVVTGQFISAQGCQMYDVRTKRCQTSRTLKTKSRTRPIISTEHGRTQSSKRAMMPVSRLMPQRIK